MKTTYWFLLTLVLTSKIVLADTHYIATTGSDNGTCTSISNPCLSFRYAFSQMLGGDTLEVENGTYSGVNNTIDELIPSGTSANYTVIKARNIDDSTSHVTITAPFAIGDGAGTPPHHYEIHGLKFKSTSGKGLVGHDIKIFKTAFEGGAATGNQMTFSIGDNTAGKTYNILLEDIWSYGLGGRYNILIYNSQNIVVRRAVIRHDGGWACDGSNPESAITIYNSRFIELQNVIVLDGVSTAGDCQGFNSFYNVSNNAGGTQHENVRIVGSIAINNSSGSGMSWDAPNSINNAVLENSAIMNSGNGIIANGSSKNVTIKNVTITGNADGIAKYDASDKFTISNTIIYNNSGESLRGVPGSDVVGGVLCYSTSGTGSCSIANIDPSSAGLTYLARIETTSYLSTAGTGGNQIGAQIVNKTGVSGTLYGESGFNVSQSALWPWPNQNRIAADLCAVRNTGFCNSNITNYIWSALGTATPSNINIVPMPTPTGIQVIKN